MHEQFQNANRLCFRYDLCHVKLDQAFSIILASKAATGIVTNLGLSGLASSVLTALGASALGAGAGACVVCGAVTYGITFAVVKGLSAKVGHYLHWASLPTGVAYKLSVDLDLGESNKKEDLEDDLDEQRERIYSIEDKLERLEITLNRIAPSQDNYSRSTRRIRDRGTIVASRNKPRSTRRIRQRGRGNQDREDGQDKFYC